MNDTLNNCFFDTLSAVANEIARRLVADRAELAEDDRFDLPMAALVPQYDGVGYGREFRGNAALRSYRGKPTKRWAHSVICRLETGRYELTFYVL